MSHAIACPMQLVLCNYTNLQLHVSHATEFQLHATVAKLKISSSVKKRTSQKERIPRLARRIEVQATNVRDCP
jgi:hypothetical protein